MSFHYLAVNSDCFRQGEILYNLNEVRVVSIGDSDADVSVKHLEHAYAMLVSQDCDLEWDYRMRHGEGAEHKLLHHMLFCDLFEEGEIRSSRGLTTEPFKRVRQNQDERYHLLVEARVAGTEETIPELIADFKRVFSVPTEFAYQLASSGRANRKGVVPAPYLQDFMHRLYSYLSRVALPD